MSKTKTVLAAVAALSLFASTPAFAQQDMHKHETVMAGEIAISGGWTRATLPNQKVGGGFLTIENKGGEDDRIVSVTSPASPDVQLHEMAVVDDVMKMRQLSDGIAVPAGETVELKPGGLHLMFMAIPAPFEEGKPVPVTLVFEKAGTVELDLAVAPAGSKEMPMGEHKH